MDHVWHFLVEDGLPFTGFLLSFFLVIFFHEYGHYIFSRLFNVRVLSLSVGYGWKLFSRKDKNGTDWSVHALPFAGGIVIAGQGWMPDSPVNTESQTDLERQLYATPREHLFRSKPAWQRLMIVIAGPLFNMILAFFLLYVVLAGVGEPVRTPYITGVLVDSPADKAGLQPGDKILQINGVEIDNYRQIKKFIQSNAGNELEFVVRRDDGSTGTLRVTPEIRSFQDINYIQRSYPQIGILAQSTPMDLRSISKINDMETDKKRSVAREKILNVLGERVVLELKTIDGTYKSYKFHLRENINKDLKTPGALEYNNVFLGQFKDNHIQDYDFGGALIRAAEETWRLVKGVASLPYNALPFDKSLIKAQTTMTGYGDPISYVFYKIFFLGAAISVFLGMINLIPLPSFDGSRIISIFCSMFPKSEIVEIYAQRSVLTLFILSVIFVNSLRIASIQ